MKFSLHISERKNKLCAESPIYLCIYYPSIHPPSIISIYSSIHPSSIYTSNIYSLSIIYLPTYQIIIYHLSTHHTLICVSSVYSSSLKHKKPTRPPDASPSLTSHMQSIMRSHWPYLCSVWLPLPW